MSEFQSCQTEKTGRMWTKRRKSKWRMNMYAPTVAPLIRRSGEKGRMDQRHFAMPADVSCLGYGSRLCKLLTIKSSKMGKEREEEAEHVGGTFKHPATSCATKRRKLMAAAHSASYVLEDGVLGLPLLGLLSHPKSGVWAARYLTTEYLFGSNST